MSADNDRIVVSEKASTGAGWFIAGILIAAIAGGGLLYATGMFSQKETVSIELKVPDEVVPQE